MPHNVMTAWRRVRRCGATVIATPCQQQYDENKRSYICKRRTINGVWRNNACNILIKVISMSINEMPYIMYGKWRNNNNGVANGVA